MKHLMQGAVIVLVLASISSVANAAGISHSNKIPHLIHSVAYPNNARIRNATYHFGLDVVSTPISQLSISIPSEMRVRDFEVRNQMGERIAATVSTNSDRTILSFDQPIVPGTQLEVDLKGIQINGGVLGRVWTLPAAISTPGLSAEIPIGSVRIQTVK